MWRRRCGGSTATPDHIVTLTDAKPAVEHLRDAELALRPTERHLGAFAVAHQVLDFIYGSL